jgi:hypothetical protein
LKKFKSNIGKSGLVFIRILKVLIIIFVIGISVFILNSKPVQYTLLLFPLLAGCSLFYFLYRRKSKGFHCIIDRGYINCYQGGIGLVDIQIGAIVKVDRHHVTGGIYYSSKDIIRVLQNDESFYYIPVKDKVEFIQHLLKLRPDSIVSPDLIQLMD